MLWMLLSMPYDAEALKTWHSRHSLQEDVLRRRPISCYSCLDADVKTDGIPIGFTGHNMRTHASRGLNAGQVVKLVMHQICLTLEVVQAEDWAVLHWHQCRIACQ